MNRDNKVVAIRGEVQVETGGVCADVVEKLQELLEQAQAGEISALAYVVARPGNRVSRGWVSTAGDGHRLSTGILQLSASYAAAWDED